MTTWTPKHPGGVQSQWAPPAADAKWDESNLLVYNTQIKQVRLLHLENIYRYMYHWLKEESWSSVHEGLPNAIEDFYGEARDQQGHKEIRFWWRVQKSPGGYAGGEHPFFNFKWYIDVLCTNVKRVEMMYNGKKIKPHVGEFLMWFNSVLEIDKNKWFHKDSKFQLGKILEDFFLRMIYKDRMREQEVELRRASERFIEDLKYYLNLNRNTTFDKRKPLSENQQWF